MNKPFSQSADNNKEPILKQLQRELSAGQVVLEIGSGTGQHACFFASAFPEVLWQATELEHNIPTIRQWMSEHQRKNLLDAKTLDINDHPWPTTTADVCYTCNTFHIVSMDSVCSIFTGSKAVLKNSGKLCVYGPFSINGKHISPSNQQFDEYLRASDRASGVRDLTELDEIAQRSGFNPCRYTAMPANNFFVVWETGRQGD